MNISYRTLYNYQIFDISGDVNYDDTKYLYEYVLENLSDKYSKVIINLLKVPYMTSSAISTIFNLRKVLNVKKVELSLMNVNKDIKATLRVTEILQFFPIIKDEQELIDSNTKHDVNSLLDNESI